MQQKITDVTGLPVQNLADQVVDNVAVIALKRLDKVLRVFLILQGECRQL